MVRTPTAGKASAAAAGASTLAATVSPSRDAATVKASTAGSAQSKPSQDAAPTATAARTSEPAQPAVAAAKKPQKVASGQSRRRDQAAIPPPASPYASHQFGGLFGLFR